MNASQRLLLLLSSPDYTGYVQSLFDGNPGVWLRHNETTGTTAFDSGPSGLNATNTGATIAQTGQLGANEAYDFGLGSGDNLAIVDSGGLLDSVTTQKWAFLARADGLGDGSAGRFFNWDNTNNRLHFLSSNRLIAVLPTAGDDANATTVTDAIADCISAWAWYFMDFDNADALGNGRKIRLFKGIGGVVTQLSLATDDAATGTYTATSSNDLYLGNRQSTTIGFDGLMDETLLIANSLWTADELQTLVDLTGV